MLARLPCCHTPPLRANRVFVVHQSEPAPGPRFLHRQSLRHDRGDVNGWGHRALAHGMTAREALGIYLERGERVFPPATGLRRMSRMLRWVFPATLVRSLVMTGGSPAVRATAALRVRVSSPRMKGIATNRRSGTTGSRTARASDCCPPCGTIRGDGARHVRAGHALGITPISRRAARSTRPPSTAGGPRNGT